MKKYFYFCNLYWLILSISIILTNLIVQKFVLNNFSLNDYLQIFKNFNLIYVQNFGSAFSFLSKQNGWQRWFFIFFGIVISCILIIAMCLESFNRKMIILSFSCIIGGALGNVFDRMIYGFVIDFIDIYIGFLHFPTFNINDVGIFVGFFLFLLDNYIYD